MHIKLPYHVGDKVYFIRKNELCERIVRSIDIKLGENDDISQSVYNLSRLDSHMVTAHRAEKYMHKTPEDAINDMIKKSSLSVLVDHYGI